MLLSLRAFAIAALLLGTASAQGFRVIKAEYGADSTWLDVTERLQNLVRGDGLVLRVNAATLTDPMPGVQKTLRVRYLYRGRTRTDNFQDLADVRLGNPEGDTLNPAPNTSGVRGGAGGGSVFDNRARGNNRTRSDLSITRAEYGQGTRWLDVTDMLNQQINGGALRVDVNNTTMGRDPAPANVKTLRVQYYYQGQQRTVTVAENTQLNLPDGAITPVVHSNGLTVIEAFYQAQGRRNNVTGLLVNAVRNDSLNLRVTNATMGGDPYPGPDKDLYVRYSYRGREFESTTREGLVITLPNPNDRATTGSGSIFGGGGGGATGFAIESATWGSGNRSVDVTRDLQDLVRDSRLSARAENSTFHNLDPAVGADKELVVRYRDSSGRAQTLRVREGTSINLP